MTMLLLLTLLTGCRDASEVNDHFFVRSGDALLPVQVRGNTTRGVLVLFESGGPSGPGIAERMVGSMQFAEGLEAEVALAFYDRRGVGNAQGDYGPEDLTMAHALDDLDAVLAVLDDQYAPDHVVLMGHSWGGFVTARYLLDGPRTVDAWVPVAGAVLVGDDLYIPYRRAFACRVAEEQQAAHPDAALWQELDAWCLQNPTVAPDSPEKDQLWVYLDDIYDRLGSEPPIEVLPVLGAAMGSMYNLIDTMARENRVSAQLYGEVDGTDLLPALSAITVPTLVVSGQYDDLIPVEVGEATLTHLGTPADQRSHLVIEGGGHYAFDADPEGFNEAVLALIAALEAAP